MAKCTAEVHRAEVATPVRLADVSRTASPNVRASGPVPQKVNTRNWTSQTARVCPHRKVWPPRTLVVRLPAGGLGRTRQARPGVRRGLIHRPWRVAVDPELTGCPALAHRVMPRAMCADRSTDRPTADVPPPGSRTPDALARAASLREIQEGAGLSPHSLPPAGIELRRPEMQPDGAQNRRVPPVEHGESPGNENARRWADNRVRGDAFPLTPSPATRDAARTPGPQEQAASRSPPAILATPRTAQHVYDQATG